MPPHEPIPVFRKLAPEGPAQRLRLSGARILKLSSAIAALSSAALIVRIAAEIVGV